MGTVCILTTRISPDDVAISPSGFLPFRVVILRLPVQMVSGVAPTREYAMALLVKIVNDSFLANSAHDAAAADDDDRRNLNNCRCCYQLSYPSCCCRHLALLFITALC